MRVQVSWLGQLITKDGRQLAVKVVDISRSGAGVSGDDKMRRLSEVELRVSVPILPDLDEHQLLHIRATVVYQRLSEGAWRSGLQFIDPTPTQHALLKTWLVKRSQFW